MWNGGEKKLWLMAAYLPPLVTRYYVLAPYFTVGFPTQVDFTCALLRALQFPRNSAKFLAIPRNGFQIKNSIIQRS